MARCSDYDCLEVRSFSCHLGWSFTFVLLFSWAAVSISLPVRGLNSSLSFSTISNFFDWGLGYPRLFIEFIRSCDCPYSCTYVIFIWAEEKKGHEWLPANNQHLNTTHCKRPLDQDVQTDEGDINYTLTSSYDLTTVVNDALISPTAFCPWFSQLARDIHLLFPHAIECRPIA